MKCSGYFVHDPYIKYKSNKLFDLVNVIKRILCKITTSSDSIFKSTMVMIIITMGFKLFSLIKEMVVAAKFGVSAEMDTYYLLLGTSSFICALFSNGIQGSFIPTYIDLLQKDKNIYSDRIASSVYNFFFLLIFFISITACFFKKTVLQVVAPGFNGATLQIGLKYATYFFPLIIVLFVEKSLQSLLEAKKRFIASKIGNGCMPFAIMLSIFLFYQYGVLSILIGLYFGYFCSISIKLISLKVINTSYLPVISFRDKYFKKILRLYYPLFFGSLISSSNVMVDRAMISLLPEGDLAIFGYSNVIISNLNGIIITTLATAMFPAISYSISAYDFKKASDSISSCISFLSFILIPLTLFLVLFSVPLVDFFYGRGAFTDHAVNRVAYVLSIYLFSTIFSSYIIIFARCFNALKNSIIPMIGGIVSCSFNIIFNLLLMKNFGIYGIAFSTLFVNLLVSLFFFLLLKFKYKEIDFNKHLIAGIVNILVISIISVLTSYLIYKILFNYDKMGICVALLCGMACFCFLSNYCNVPEFIFIKNKIKSIKI